MKYFPLSHHYKIKIILIKFFFIISYYNYFNYKQINNNKKVESKNYTAKDKLNMNRQINNNPRILNSSPTATSLGQYKLSPSLDGVPPLVSIH
jgi:type II secretory pathway component PulC